MPTQELIFKNFYLVDHDEAAHERRETWQRKLVCEGVEARGVGAERSGVFRKEAQTCAHVVVELALYKGLYCSLSEFLL